MISLQKFVDRVQGCEARGLKDVSFSLTEAKAMQADLTRLLLELQAVRQNANKPLEEEVIRVNMDGGSFL